MDPLNSALSPEERNDLLRALEIAVADAEDTPEDWDDDGEAVEYVARATELMARLNNTEDY